MIPWTTIIANALENGFGWEPQEIAKHLREAQAKIDAKTKPLNDDEIDEILDSLIDEDEGCSYYDFARAIEERHGIK